MDTEENTIYIGNLDSRVDEMLLQELVMQFAPVSRVRLPKDKVNGNSMGYGFVTLQEAGDVSYVMAVVNGMQLYNRSLRVNRVRHHH